MQKVITDRCPGQLRLDLALWTRGAVKLAMRRKCDIDMPTRTVGEYLRRWRYAPQRPAGHAHGRDAGKAKEWPENTYPKIKKREKADVCRGDGAAVKAHDVCGRGHAPGGERPAVKRAAKKGGASAVSATSGKGKIYWRLHEGSVNAEKPKEFVERLTYGKKRRVFLILDNAKTHRGKILSERAGKSKKRAALFYPPPYSHGSNSGERVNADVKYGGGIQDA